MIFDCIVAGAGPAGSSAAYHLANRGFSVLLVEKNKLPRYKPCGGLVIDRVAEWFDFDFSPAISLKVSRVRMVNERRGNFNAELELPRPVWMVHREIFDHFVVQQAVKRGAVLLEEFPVSEVAPTSGGWRVFSGDRSHEGRYLIAADGAKGTLARRLGFESRVRLTAGALEAEIPDSHPPEPVMHLSITKRLPGYSWNFPKALSHSIGSGLWNMGGTSNGGGARLPLRDELESYCETFGLNTANGRVCGHPLLLWNGNQKLHTERALLAGEAACMVDPWSGEGIRPAMMSGMNAAQAIGAALNGASNALAGYTEAMHKATGQEMSLARIMAVELYSREPANGGTAALRPLGLDLAARLICGDIGYQKFVMGNAVLHFLQPAFSARPVA